VGLEVGAFATGCVAVPDGWMQPGNCVVTLSDLPGAAIGWPGKKVIHVMDHAVRVTT